MHRIFILRLRRAEGSGHDPFRSEAGIHVEQLTETRQQKPGTKEQGKGKADLRHHQALPHSARAFAAAASSLVLAQNLLQPLLREPEYGKRGDEHTRCRGHQCGHCDYVATDCHFMGARKMVESCHCQGAQSGRAQCNAERATHGRQYRILGQELAH